MNSLQLCICLLVSVAYAARSFHCARNVSGSFTDGTEKAIQAHANVTYSGHVSAGMMQRYDFNMPTRATVQFTLRELAGGRSDCDMLTDAVLAIGSNALLCWDRSNSYRRAPELSLMSYASLGNFSAFVYGYQNCTYNFTASVFFGAQSGCANDCSLRGSCQEGDPDALSFTCNCSAGFTGSYCEQQVGLLEPDSPVSGYVTPGGDFWNYYAFNGSANADTVFTITREGAFWYDLYFQEGAPPTRYNATRVYLGTGQSVLYFSSSRLLLNALVIGI
jgi:hypothetical protein